MEVDGLVAAEEVGGKEVMTSLTLRVVRGVGLMLGLLLEVSRATIDIDL